jgi:hypothetical protein
MFEQFKVYDHTSDEYKIFEGGNPSSNTAGRERHPDWETLPLSGKARVRAVGFANRAALLAEVLQKSRKEVPLPRAMGEREGAISSESRKAQSWPPRWTKTWNSLELHLRTFSGKNKLSTGHISILIYGWSHPNALLGFEHDWNSHGWTCNKSIPRCKVRNSPCFFPSILIISLMLWSTGYPVGSEDWI